LVEEIKKIHPYDVPEVIIQPIIGGNPSYLEWIRNSTNNDKRP